MLCSVLHPPLMLQFGETFYFTDGERDLRKQARLRNKYATNRVKLGADMPRLSGVGLFEQIRQLPPWPHGRIDLGRLSAQSACVEVCAVDGPGQLVAEVDGDLLGCTCLRKHIEYGQPTMDVIEHVRLEGLAERGELAHADHDAVGWIG